MDNKHQASSAITQQKQQTKTVPKQNGEDSFNQPATPSQTPPKITVSLPKHVASRLRDLVQKRDIALIRLGIISVQFENDQIIPLALNTTNSTQPKPQSLAPTGPIIGSTVQSCNNERIDNLAITLSELASPDSPIIGDGGDSKSIMNASSSELPILDSSLAVSTASMALATSMATATTIAKTKCNTTNLAVAYDNDDDDDDDKDEDEVVSEVENQHSSYNIHQLSQLEFADPIELEMYDNDNLLFPDYTLNLS